MEEESALNKFYEHRLIRMTQKTRLEHDFHIGDFIYLRDKWGNFLTLQVAEAYKADITSGSCGFVTKANCNKLFLKHQDFSEVIAIKDITLGCDPEAFLADVFTGNIVAAHRFMKKSGDVGHDGLLLEFRPLPSTDENEVTANIAKLIVKARTMLNKTPEGPRTKILSASSYHNLTAGFHLHYGLPRGLLSSRPGTSVVAQLMTKAFDYYIGVPSIIPEGNKDNARRTIPFVEYGKPGGYRLDNRTFEYRLPGGINLRHPCLARGLIALGAVVVEDLVSRINTSTDFFSNLKDVASDKDLKDFYPALPDIDTLYSLICSPAIEPAKKHFEKIKEDIRKMIGYKDRATSVEAYFNCLDADVQYDSNLEVNWGGFDEK